MNEPTAAKTPEQIAQIKRLAPPIAVAALVMAVVGILLLLLVQVSDRRPPSLAGVNLAFCAMMMGLGILVWAKGSGAVPWAMRFSLIAIIIGAVGPFIFFKRGVDLRMAMEHKELGNVTAIAQAAQAYARASGGTYPPNLAVLLEQKYLTPDDLVSPYKATMPLPEDSAALHAKLSPIDLLKEVDAHSDYTYAGADLTAPPKAAQPPDPAILVAWAKDPVMRINLAVAFTDGTSRFITLEEAEKVLKASNAARQRAGLPALRPPETVQRAESQDRSANPGQQP